MANIPVKVFSGAEAKMKGSGTGTDGDPYIPQQQETNSAAILAAAQAIELAAADIKAAVEGTLAVAGAVTTGGLTDGELRASPVPVSAAALPLPSGAATAANQATAIGHLATIAGAAGDGLTDAELRASPVPVSGTVTASGPLTDAQLRASAVPVLDTNSAALLTAAQAIQAAAEILDNVVSGSEAQVDVVGALPAGTNNIGNVDIASALPAGTNLIGTVGAPDIVITVTPTLDTNAYTSGDLLFDSTEIANAVRVNGGTAILQSVTIIDKDDQLKAMKLIFADAATDFGTVNSPPDPDDTEAATVIGHYEVSISDTSQNIDLGTASVHCCRNIGLLLQAGASTTSIWVAAMTMGTPTHSASGLVLKLGFLRS